MSQKPLKEHVCLKCDHVWYSVKERPARCPHCKTAMWDKTTTLVTDLKYKSLLAYTDKSKSTIRDWCSHPHRFDQDIAREIDHRTGGRVSFFSCVYGDSPDIPSVDRLFHTTLLKLKEVPLSQTETLEPFIEELIDFFYGYNKAMGDILSNELNSMRDNL